MKILRRAKRRLWAKRSRLADAMVAEPGADNGMFLLFSNGIGPDDDEIRTANAMVLDPTVRLWPSRALRMMRWWWPIWTLRYRDVVGRRWLRARRPAIRIVDASQGKEQTTRRVRFGDETRVFPPSAL